MTLRGEGKLEQERVPRCLTTSDRDGKGREPHRGKRGWSCPFAAFHHRLPPFLTAPLLVAPSSLRLEDCGVWVVDWKWATADPFLQRADKQWAAVIISSGAWSASPALEAPPSQLRTLCFFWGATQLSLSLWNGPKPGVVRKMTSDHLYKEDFDAWLFVFEL